MKKSILFCLSLVLLAACGKDEPKAKTPIPPDATKVLKDTRFQAPDGWRWGSLVQADGSTIRYGFVAPAFEGAGTIYFLPGYSAPVEIYFETMRELMAEGFGILALDWPGQGGSSRPLRDVEKIHAISLDGHLDAASDVLRVVLPQDPLMMLGSSMGGQLGTRFLAAHGTEFAAAVFIAPAYAIHTGSTPEWVARLLAKIMPLENYTPQSQGWDFNPAVLEGVSSCSQDHVRMQLWQAWMVEQNELRIGGMTYGFLNALFQSADEAAAPTTLETINTPILMATGGRDYFVQTKAAQKGCNLLQNCSALHYEKAMHCLLEETDAIRVPMMADIISFFKRHRR